MSVADLSAWDIPWILAGVFALTAFIVVTSKLQAAQLSKWQKLIDDVNAVLPPDRRFDALGWHPAKIERLFREHRRFYPSSRLIEETRKSTFVSVIPFVVVAIPILWGIGVGIVIVPLVLFWIVGAWLFLRY